MNELDDGSFEQEVFKLFTKIINNDSRYCCKGNDEAAKGIVSKLRLYWTLCIKN